MMGNDDEKTGRPPKISDEDILNVFRRSGHAELTVSELLEAESIDYSDPAIRKRLEQLESDNRIVTRKSGDVQLFKLSELEPQIPVEDSRIARAHRLANLAKYQGRTFFYFSFGFAMGAIMLFIAFLHANVGQFNPPFVSLDRLLFFGCILAYLSAGMFIVTGLTYGSSISLPHLTRWWINRETENKTSGEGL